MNRATDIASPFLWSRGVKLFGATAKFLNSNAEDEGLHSTLLSELKALDKHLNKTTVGGWQAFVQMFCSNVFGQPCEVEKSKKPYTTS